jgi:hypothetical protein
VGAEIIDINAGLGAVVLHNIVNGDRSHVFNAIFRIIAQRTKERGL